MFFISISVIILFDTFAGIAALQKHLWNTGWGVTFDFSFETQCSLYHSGAPCHLGLKQYDHHSTETPRHSVLVRKAVVSLIAPPQK